MRGIQPQPGYGAVGRVLRSGVLLLFILMGCHAGPSVVRIPMTEAMQGGHSRDRINWSELVVLTPTRLHMDGGIAYYPHMAYDIFEADGARVRRVLNHVGPNDETAQRIVLPPGQYIIRPQDARVEVSVILKAGKRVVIDWAKVSALAVRP